MRCALVASLLLAAGVARADEYVVRPGDTCLGIVGVLFPGDRDALARMHALNPQLGPLPHHLTPGQRLRIDRSPEARLTYVRPRVSSRRQGQADWRIAGAGLPLYRLDEVLTLPEAAAEVTFGDATRLHLDGDALIVIYGAAAGLAELRKSGTVELMHGDLRLHLRELRGEPRPDLVVTTPAASVATDARDVHVSVDRARMSRVSVHEGRADVAARQRKVRVERGFGTRVAAGKPPEDPRPLPPAPAWVAPGDRALVPALRGAGTVVLAWSGVDRVAGYRVTIARDEGMNDTVLSAEVAAADPPRAELAPARPGRYYARVLGVADDGLLGMPSARRVVDVVSVEVERGAPAGDTETLTGAGEVVVELPDLVDAVVTVDGRSAIVPVVVRGVGRHAIAVTPREGGPAFALGCDVTAPRAAVALDERAREIVVQLLDERGAPLAIEPRGELALAGREGTVVGPLRPAGTAFRARLERSGRAVAAVATWDGRPIGSVRGAAQPPGNPLGQEAAVVHLAALPAPWLPRRIAAGVRIEPALRSGEGRGTRVSVGLEVPTGALAVSGSTSISALTPDGGLAPATATLGGRARLHGGAVAVALGADATLRLGHSADEPPALQLRPVLGLGLRRGPLFLATTHGLAVDPERVADEAPTHQSVWLGGLTSGSVTFVLGGQTALAPRVDGLAAALSAGLRASYYGIDAGATVRYGLGDSGQRVFGELTAVLAFDVEL